MARGFGARPKDRRAAEDWAFRRSGTVSWPTKIVSHDSDQTRVSTAAENGPPGGGGGHFSRAVDRMIINGRREAAYEAGIADERAESGHSCSIPIPPRHSGASHLTSPPGLTSSGMTTAGSSGTDAVVVLHKVAGLLGD